MQFREEINQLSLVNTRFFAIANERELDIIKSGFYFLSINKVSYTFPCILFCFLLIIVSIIWNPGERRIPEYLLLSPIHLRFLQIDNGYTFNLEGEWSKFEYTIATDDDGYKQTMKAQSKKVDLHDVSIHGLSV